eukprot:4838152-Amphidinium_carterae.1
MASAKHGDAARAERWLRQMQRWYCHQKGLTCFSFQWFAIPGVFPSSKGASFVMIIMKEAVS